jgi:hypothetical protein
MMLNPSAISPDGFALLNPNIIGGVLELPVVTGVYYE